MLDSFSITQKPFFAQSFLLLYILKTDQYDNEKCNSGYFNKAECIFCGMKSKTFIKLIM